jgi:hypothetical protein
LLRKSNPECYQFWQLIHQTFTWALKNWPKCQNLAQSCHPAWQTT